MRIATVGLDVAKQLFQAHGTDVAGKVVFRRRPRRVEIASFFAGAEVPGRSQRRQREASG